MTDLEGIIVHTEPRSINVNIVDALFFLHLINYLTTTFGDIRKFILSRLCKLECDQIHLVFDKVVKPPIKDCERDARAGASDRSETFEIYEPSQKRPKNFRAALRNDNFEESLIRFLVSSWEEPSTAEILTNKTFFVSCDNRCFCYNVEDGQLQRNEETHLYINQEEADSRMISHLKSLSGRNNIVVRTNDTDVLVIILSNMDKLNASSQIWLEVGVSTLNTLRYIEVTSLYTHLGSPLCAALAGFHAFTGCDYTSSFTCCDYTSSFTGCDYTSSFTGCDYTSSFTGCDYTSSFTGCDYTSSFTGCDYTSSFTGCDYTSSFTGCDYTSSFTGCDYTSSFTGCDYTSSFIGCDYTSSFTGCDYTSSFTGCDYTSSFTGCDIYWL